MTPHLPTLLRLLRATFSPRRFRARHAAWVVGLGVVFAWFVLLGASLRLLDRLLFPRYREVEIRRPIFILANPRSGTTFLHRLLSLDPQFSSIALYHTLVPSVTFFRLVDALAALDRAVGRPLARLVAFVDRRAFGGWEGIHTVGLGRAEEDEMLWLYSLLSPASLLLFPFFDELRGALRVDELPAEHRARLASAYRDALQRRMSVAPPGTTLLAKNAIAQGRIHTCVQALPDLRVVHLVRNPYEATASLLSMFTLPWSAHSPHLLGATPEVRQMAKELGFDYYRALMNLKKDLPPEQIIEVRYDELVKDTPAVVERIYRHFGLELSDAYRATLAREFEKSRKYESKHAYRLEDFGLTKDEVYANLADVFEHYGFAR